MAPGAADLVDALADAVLERLAPRPDGDRPLRVGVDGVDGAGKTTLATALVDGLRRDGLATDVVHVDDHLAPPEVRHRRGRRSPVGFFLDSYDDESLRSAVLAARPGVQVVVVEGIFLQRREVDGLLDVVVWLEVPPAVSVARCAARDGSDPDPRAPANARYVVGQRLYRATRAPHRRADLVVLDDGTRQVLVRGAAHDRGRPRGTGLVVGGG